MLGKRDTRRLEAVEPSGSDDYGVKAGGMEFSQAGIEIAAEREYVQVWTEVKKLGGAAQAASTDPGTGRQRVKRREGGLSAGQRWLTKENDVERAFPWRN
jgi:hypothetical protein